MRIIIGLGNPGPRFAKTRHNFGFWIANAFAAKQGLVFLPGKGDYLFASSKQEDLLVIKPTRFMNESGLSVREVLNHFGGSPADILVTYDDIDLPLGTVRFRAGGGAGTHKGIASIVYHLETEEFHRLRLGIATDAPLRPSEKYVLESFRPQDDQVVSEVLAQALEGLDYYLLHGIDKAMTRFNPRHMNMLQEEGKATQA